MTDYMTYSKTEEQYLQLFQEKQRDFYLENEKQSMKQKRLTHLKRRRYPLPKDLLNLVLSYIPEYSIIWFSNGEFNLSIKALSLHNEFLENRGKVIHNQDYFVHHGECMCSVCSHYIEFYVTEYDQFYFIANSMDVEIVRLCPDESYDDYNRFKSDNPDVKQRIIDYFYADWHRDSLLNLHISWMKRVCESRIEVCYKISREFCNVSWIKRVCKNRTEFCYELLPEFYQWARKKGHYITYESMEAFIRKLLKVTIKPNATDSDHTTILKDMFEKCNNAPFHKKPHIVAKAYRYMAYAIDYVRRNPSFYEDSIRKAHEIKGDTDNIRVHLAIDDYLALIV
jgi:hypothetical protein